MDDRAFVPDRLLSHVVRLPDFGRIAVSVLEADGSPAANAEVPFEVLDLVVPRNPRSSRVRLGKAGTFVDTRVPPGRHLVSAARDPQHLTQKECLVRSGLKTDVEIRLPR